MSEKNGWNPYKLQELGFVGRGRSRHRPRNEQSLYGGMYPFFQTGDIKAADLYLNEYHQTYNGKGLAQSKLWGAGTLCITIAANIAETAILGVEGCFPDSVVGFVADPKKSDPRFIKYYIDTIKLSMQNVSKGTTQDNLSLDKLQRFDFVVPNVAMQRKIAAILSAYDDLVENNTRRIAILEEMAQAIYREWFVNFRFPGHENVNFVDSPLGQIPEGWEINTLKEACDMIVDSEHKTAPTQTEGFPSIRTPNIGKGHLLLDGVRRVSEETYTQWTRRAVPQEGDMILAREAPVGNVAIVPSNELVCLGQRTVLIRADKSKVYPHYLLRVLLSDYCQNRFSGASSGATVAHLNLRDLRGLEIPFAPKDVQDATAPTFENLDRQIANLFKRNRILKATRDLILPKLISGKLDVEDLDIDVGMTAKQLEDAIA